MDSDKRIAVKILSHKADCNFMHIIDRVAELWSWRKQYIPRFTEKTNVYFVNQMYEWNIYDKKHTKTCF